jgi:hypothetical protein
MIGGMILSASVTAAQPGQAQQRPGLGAYPPPLGSQPPAIGSPAPAPLATPPALDPEKEEYCRRNPNSCSVRPPGTTDLLQQQNDDRAAERNKALPLPKPKPRPE